MSAGREILGNVPRWLELLMYAAMLGATAVAAARIGGQVRRWWRGAAEGPLLPLAERLRDLVRRVVAQRDIAVSDRLAGLMHRLIFWGFLGLALATTLTAVEHDLGLRILHGWFYLVFALGADLAGLAFLVGLGLAIHRRWIARLPTLAHARAGDVAAMGLLVLAGVTGFLLEGARIALDEWPAHERVAFVGWGTGLVLAPLVAAGRLAAVHRTLWGVHVAAVAGLFVALPFTRLLHTIAVPANVLLRARRLGAVRPLAGDTAPQATLAAFTWKQLLELDACTSCGRCSAACPATTSGKPLSPMLVVQHLREHRDVTAEVLPGRVTPDELWSCTTCGACEEVCPVAVNHIDRIVDLRRVLVERGAVAPAAARALESLAGKGNLWAQPPGERARWAERLGVRVLAEGEACDTIYWIGCAGAYDEQARRVSEAVASLLQRAGVVFGILGAREGCSGDVARRVGEEGLFAELARRNVEMLRGHGVRRVITHCPHCLNTFRREHGLDGIEIVHHAALLAELVAAGRLTPTRGAARRITLHDPCYLGRYQGEYVAPRAVLAALPRVEVAEMPRSRERAFCCGGGGGQVLIDVKIGERIPSLRFAEAAAVGADVVATACPFCKIMLAPVPAEQGLEGRIAVRDVAELLLEACA